MKITISDKSNESAPIVIDTNTQSSEASKGGTALRVLETVGSGGVTNAFVTLFNRIVSLGTFSSIDDMKSSNKVLNAISLKTNKNDILSLDEVKTMANDIFVNVGYGDEKDEKRRSKIYFIAWLFGVPIMKMHSGDNLDKLNGNYKLTTVDIGGDKVPICIAKLSFGRNTMDASGLVGQSLCVINTFYKDNSGKLKTVCVGKCYLKSASKNLTASENYNIIPTDSGIEFVEDF